MMRCKALTGIKTVKKEKVEWFKQIKPDLLSGFVKGYIFGEYSKYPAG